MIVLYPVSHMLSLKRRLYKKREVYVTVVVFLNMILNWMFIEHLFQVLEKLNKCMLLKNEYLVLHFLAMFLCAFGGIFFTSGFCL